MSTAVEKFEAFNRFGSVLGLERVNELLRRLGNPHNDTRCIHVSGTNGKGSTCKYLEQGLRGCGYSVGLYTSPYIEKFNERIQCDGEMITDEELEIYGKQALDAAADMVAEGLASPTEFEVVMATAFLYFKAKAPDIIVLECGMGGIGDATNVISKPLVSVFTSVGYDHMHILGNTLAEIATDKAGIIKEGCPVVSNVTDHDAAAVIARTAYQKGCRLYDVSKIGFSIDWESPEEQQVSMELWQTDYSEVITSMVGKFQAENLKTALACIEILRKAGEIKIERSRLYDGIRKAVQPGRLEVMESGRDNEDGHYVMIDGAHNDAGAEALAEAMNRLFPGKKILTVVGMVEKKETEKVLTHFSDMSLDFIATQPDYEGRAMAAEKMAGYIEEVRAKTGKDIKLKGVYDSAPEAVKAARALRSEYDVTLYAGSLYLIGEVRSILRDSKDYDYDRTLKYGSK